jgi:hypothetical protein
MSRPRSKPTPKPKPVAPPSPEAYAIGRYLELVAQAALPYESRWTLRALARVDPGLHQALAEQQELYHHALVTAEPDELKLQAEAMVRGWGAAVRRMEESGQPDDAYVVGLDTNTGIRVAIAYNKVVQARFQFLHGPRAIVLTPDEVATLVAAQGMMLAVKAAFPGSELRAVRDRQDEAEDILQPADEDDA